MDGTLLVTGAGNGEDFAAFLGSCGCRDVTLAASGGEARRLLAEREYGLVVIAAPLPDEFGRELALYAADATASGVLLVAAARAREAAEGLEEYGVAVASAPVSRRTVSQAVRLLLASRQRLLRLREENRRLMTRLEDQRLVCRAKCALIQYRGLTEEEAHHAIERRAMNLRLPRRQVALELLEAYEGTPHRGTT